MRQDKIQDVDKEDLKDCNHQYELLYSHTDKLCTASWHVVDRE